MVVVWWCRHLHYNPLNVTCKALLDGKLFDGALGVTIRRVLEAVLVIEDVIDNIDSFEPVRFIPEGGRRAPECMAQFPGLYFKGDLLTFVTSENKPYCGRHSKYLTPSTDPSFFPRGSSNSIPHHSPSANSVAPM
uniref:Uncharacterized protein n=1 Tax=Photinus pyralis TaxID=7054 RepID=A0A1Y1K353_PHOPY